MPDLPPMRVPSPHRILYGLKTTRIIDGIVISQSPLSYVLKTTSTKQENNSVAKHQEKKRPNKTPIMEIAGMTIGDAGLVLAFESVLATMQQIPTAKNYPKDYTRFARSVKIQLGKLEIWKRDGQNYRLKDDLIAEHVWSAIEGIQELLEELEIMEEEYRNAVGVVGGNKMGGMPAAGRKMSLALACTTTTLATGSKVVKRSKIKEVEVGGFGEREGGIRTEGVEGFCR